MSPQEFWSGWWWPALTATLGFVFAWLVFAQWLARRKPHQLSWSVGLLMYAVAAVMEAYSELTGTWNPLVYRFYIVLAASMVGYLGLGSYYLLAKKKTGPHIYLGFLLVCEVIFLWGVFNTTLLADKLVPGITVGGQALGSAGSFPRIMSLPFNITGTTFLLGGALLSASRCATFPMPGNRSRDRWLALTGWLTCWRSIPRWRTAPEPFRWRGVRLVPSPSARSILNMPPRRPCWKISTWISLPVRWLPWWDPPAWANLP